MKEKREMYEEDGSGDEAMDRVLKQLVDGEELGSESEGDSDQELSQMINRNKYGSGNPKKRGGMVREVDSRPTAIVRGVKKN